MPKVAESRKYLWILLLLYAAWWVALAIKPLDRSDWLMENPIREMFLRIGNVRGFWGYFLPLDLTMSTSMLYELIEWGAAVTVGSDLGQAYLGTQGDVWDAHKDMALASLGALIAMLLTAAVNRRMQRDFAQEWAESIRVKR